MSRDQREHLNKIISWGDLTELDQHKWLLRSQKTKQNKKTACYAETVFWNLYQVRIFLKIEKNWKNAWKLAIINMEIVKLDVVKKSKEKLLT